MAQSASGNHVYSYDAYGIELSSNEGMPTNAIQASEVTHRYTGEYNDQQTGMVYLRARDYDAGIGRFISMDQHPGAKRTPLTLNKYLYTNSDPLNAIDPSGNFGLTMSMPSISLNLGAISAYGGILSNIGARFLLIYGVSALSGSSSMIVNQKSKDKARDQLKDIVISKAIEKKKNSSETLYHYTNQTAAMEIFATQEMTCSKKYGGNLGGPGSYFPAGAYATDIEPWNPIMTNKDLANLFYGGNLNRDLSWFVALDGEEFSPLHGAPHQFIRFCQPGDSIAVEIYYFGPSLLN